MAGNSYTLTRPRSNRLTSRRSPRRVLHADERRYSSLYPREIIPVSDFARIIQLPNAAVRIVGCYYLLQFRPRTGSSGPTRDCRAKLEAEYPPRGSRARTARRDFTCHAIEISLSSRNKGRAANTSFIQSNVSFPIRRRDSGYKFPRSNIAIPRSSRYRINRKAFSILAKVNPL